MKAPYIPTGCDQQGRITPAEAATEIGCDDEDNGLPLFLAALAAAIIGLLTLILTYMVVYG